MSTDGRPADVPADGPDRPDPHGMVDWDLAVRVGARLAGEGPAVGRAEADAAVAELRAGADRSTALVRDFTGLEAADHTAPVLVVDRRGWIQANADAFQHVMGPLVGKLSEKKPPTGAALAIGSRITGVEVGGLLGFLGRQGAGPVRPVPRPRRAAAAGRAQHRARRARARRRPEPTSGCGSACTRRPTACSSPPCPWMRDHLFSEISALSATVSPSGLDELVKRVGARRCATGSARARSSTC